VSADLTSPEVTICGTPVWRPGPTRRLESHPPASGANRSGPRRAGTSSGGVLEHGRRGGTASDAGPGPGVYG